MHRSGSWPSQRPISPLIVDSRSPEGQLSTILGRPTSVKTAAQSSTPIRLVMDALVHIRSPTIAVATVRHSTTATIGSHDLLSSSRAETSDSHLLSAIVRSTSPQKSQGIARKFGWEAPVEVAANAEKRKYYGVNSIRDRATGATSAVVEEKMGRKRKCPVRIPPLVPTPS